LQITPAAHWQAPLSHICPAEHAMPQPPQFRGSDIIVTQTCPQAVWSTGQIGPRMTGLASPPQATVVNATPTAMAAYSKTIRGALMVLSLAVLPNRPT
jgi:hypothetical protein